MRVGVFFLKTIFLSDLIIKTQIRWLKYAQKQITEYYLNISPYLTVHYHLFQGAEHV